VAVYDVDDGGVVLAVRVQPGAARPGVVGRHGDAVKVRVAAAPEQGKANAALVELLAAELGVRRADVEVVAGRTNRTKRVRIAGVDAGRVEAWLAGLA
jgi:uncharacterized protein (TIGR00251 family)